jgi:hypothetical protein
MGAFVGTYNKGRSPVIGAGVDAVTSQVLSWPVPSCYLCVLAPSAGSKGSAVDCHFRRVHRQGYLAGPDVLSPGWE